MNPSYPPAGQSIEPDQTARPERIRIPEGWLLGQWGDWTHYAGAHLPEGPVDIELFVQMEDPDAWTIVLYWDRNDRSVLLNPVSTVDADNVRTDFWPECVEELGSLFLQVGRYGHATPVQGGWEVHSTVTAAAARVAAAAADERRTVTRSALRGGWVFTDTGAPVVVAVSASVDHTPSAGVALPTTSKSAAHRPPSTTISALSGSAARRSATPGTPDRSARGR